MTALELFKGLQEKQVKWMLVDGELELLAPKGVLTEEIKALLVQHKVALLELFLSGEMGPSSEEIPLPVSDDEQEDEDNENDDLLYDDAFDEFMDICSQCGAMMEYYSDLGEPYCKVHRFEKSQQQCQASPALALVTQAAFFGQDLAAICVLLRPVSGPIALDLETTGLSPLQDRIVSISLGIPDHVFVVDMRPYCDLNPDQQAEWKSSLNQLFESLPDQGWIGHNIKFDWSFLAVHLYRFAFRGTNSIWAVSPCCTSLEICLSERELVLGVRLRQVYDTMVVEQVLQAGRDTPSGFFTLQETAERYGFKVSKQQRNWFVGLNTRAKEWAAPFPHEQLVYMVQDIEITYRIAELQRGLLTHHQLEMVAQLENQALPAIASMEVHGVLIDRQGWERILSDKRARKIEMEQDLIETLGAALYTGREQSVSKLSQQYERHQRARAKEGNRLMQEYTASSEKKGQSHWNKFYSTGLKAWDALHPEPMKPERPSRTIKLSSPSQVKEALSYLGINVASTEEEVLEGYVRQHPIIEKLLTWRKLNHFCHAFGDNLLAHIKADGRIHASFAQAGAVSGRIICRDPNLQQIPKRTAQATEGEDVRRCFIAPEGSRILTADLSNIELRILAEVSGDPAVLQLFAQGKDMHTETARAMFGLSADIDTREHIYKGVAVRDIAKTINFGLVYGMGVQGLAKRIGVSTEEAQKLISRYFATYAGIDKWLRQITEQAMKSGYATTLAGRKRFFTLTAQEKEQRTTIARAARNHPIQGTNADILKRALALLYEALPEGVHLLLCVHDEIVLECPEDQLEEAERMLKVSMVQACRDYLKVVAIPEPEVVIGHAWIKK